MKELKVGDKVKTTKEVTFVNGGTIPKGSLLTFKCRVDELNASFLKDENGVIIVSHDDDFELVKEETNKLKMVIGENRQIKLNNENYWIEWFHGEDYLLDDNYSRLLIYKKGHGDIYNIKFHNHNYNQQLEITNLILDKLESNVELVQDVNVEVLKQIEKLESEVAKLKGMVKYV